MEEIWIKINKYNCKNIYSISNMGNVMNNVTGRILKKSVRDGYYAVSLMNEHNKVSLKENIHLLVAEHFIRKRNKKNEVINHLNLNKLDNRLENLEIISARKNTVKAIEILKCFSSKPVIIRDLKGIFIEEMINAKAVGEKYKLSANIVRKICEKVTKPRNYIFEYPNDYRSETIDFELGDEYKIIPCVNSNYVASKYGDVINLKTKKLLKQVIMNNGYHVVKLMNNNIQKKCLVHRLIAITFIKNTDPNKIFVNHKDKNKSHNNVENLEWVTNKENIIHSKNRRCSVND